jgi:quercetin dioxygenase-like cupin family protein
MVRSNPEKETPVEVQPRSPSLKGPAEWFTGDVWIDPIVRGEDPSRIRALAVHFSPGARTAWHAHGLGQTLYVTDGEGRIQARGGERVTIRAGDVVHTPPGEWHWHGAAPDRVMTHLSLTEGVAEGPETEWGEHVSEADYGG